MRRKVQLAVSVAEYVLDRQIRTVLDVGCGEGRWLGALRAIRPRVRYTGVETSEYAVSRFGRKRNIRYGTVSDLDAVGLNEGYDLVVCADVLHYLNTTEVALGLRQLRERMTGVGYLEVFSSDDAFSGDRSGWHRRTARWYRRAFRSAGLIPCGSHCYASPSVQANLSSLETL